MCKKVMRSISGYRVDCNGMGALKGQFSLTASFQKGLFGAGLIFQKIAIVLLNLVGFNHG